MGHQGRLTFSVSASLKNSLSRTVMMPLSYILLQFQLVRDVPRYSICLKKSSYLQTSNTCCIVPLPLVRNSTKSLFEPGTQKFRDGR